MSSPVVIGFSLGDIEGACDECIVRQLKDQLTQLIKHACHENKERGASIISLTDMITGSILESIGYDMLGAAEIEKIAQEFINHPRIKPYSYRPLVLIIHSFFRP
jgi:hypothetical protein